MHFDLIDTWRAMEELVDDRLIKSIGISNFNVGQVDYIVTNARIKTSRQSNRGSSVLIEQ